MASERFPIVRAAPAQSAGEVTGRDFASGACVQLAWADGRITRIEDGAGARPDIWIAPTLFDLQVNGYGGVDFQRDDLSAEQLLFVVRKLREAGCTRFLFTLITDEWSRLMRRLSRAREIRSGNLDLRNAIVGWHIEGPFLSPKPGFHGTHDPDRMCNPAPELISELRAVTGRDMVLLTIAPERPGSLECLELAVSLGIKVSLGHTDASAEALRSAVAAGATGFTHLGNGCPAELNRHDNIVLRVLDQPGLWVSLIPDKIHVSPAFFRLVHRLLAREGQGGSVAGGRASTPVSSRGIYYVTDAMAAAGAPPGRYTLRDIELEVGPDQVVRRPGSPFLSGSALRPIDGVLRAAQMLNASWREVWPAFSERPARFLGFPSPLSVGQPADFCVLTHGKEGEIWELKVYSSQNECD